MLDHKNTPPDLMVWQVYQQLGLYDTGYFLSYRVYSREKYCLFFSPEELLYEHNKFHRNS